MSAHHNKPELLKNSLLNFYSKKKNIDAIINIIPKKSKYSLRLCEWVATDYAKRHNVIYSISKTKEFNMYSSYKEYLFSYQKKQFDPFKRNYEGYEKFMLEYPGGSFETTVCQLNFFRWAISNKILKYLEDNFEAVRDDMDKYKAVKGPKKKSKNEQKIVIRGSPTVLKF